MGRGKNQFYMKESEHNFCQKMFNNLLTSWVTKLKEIKQPTQEKSVEEWIDIYEGAN
jgi:hypothetical protein